MMPIERTTAPCRIAVWLVLAIFVDCLVESRRGHAAELELMNVGVRTRVGEKRVLGEVAPESFRGHDLVATFRLPWQSFASSGFGVSSRILAGAGVLEGAGRTALVLSATPAISFGSEDGLFSVDMGAGLAVITRQRFAQQDFGGPLQFSLTLGASAPLFRQISAGYRFMHYSDAGIHGPHTIGVDFHMIECLYRF